MKLNKELVIEGITNQLVVIGHMYIFNIISFILFWISYIGTKSIELVPSGFLRTEGYEVNLFFVISSWIMFLIVFSIFYTKVLKKYLKKQFEIHWLFVVIFVIVSLIFCFVEIFLLFLAALFNIGILSPVVNFPKSIDVIVVTYVIGYIVIDLIRERINKTKDKNNTKSST